MVMGESVAKIVEKTAGYFVPAGQQVQMIINNESSYTLQLSGSNVAAGAILSKGDQHFGPPDSIAPGENGVVLIDSTGWAAQVCVLYGIEDAENRRQLAMLYAYNPKDIEDVDNYAGWHNPAGNGRTIGRKEWDESRFNRGRYAGNRLCEEANEGSGPDWQVNATVNPVLRFRDGKLEGRVECSKEDLEEGSRFKPIFMIKDA